MRQRFIQFLKDNGAFEKFLKNLDNDGPYRGLPSYRGLDTHLSFTPADQYLSGAFYIASTPEGVNYWLDLNLAWLKELSNG